MHTYRRLSTRAEREQLAAESRAFYAVRGERRGPASFEELRQARAKHIPAPPPTTVTLEEVEDASGRKIPLRIAVPTSTSVRGVYLHIPEAGST